MMLPAVEVGASVLAEDFDRIGDEKLRSRAQRERKYAVTEKSETQEKLVCFPVSSGSNGCKSHDQI